MGGTTSVISTDSSDEKKNNEFTPENNPSETPQQEGGTQDEKKFNEFTPENNPSKTPQQEGGTHQATSEDDSKKKKKKKHTWWQKADFNNMPLIEKRFYYKCRGDFSTLADILPWPEYVESHMAHLIDLGLLSENDKFHDENNKMNKKVSLWRGDITHLEIDAIVNAANTSLRGGGGVDGCIHRAAGDDLLDECITLRGCRTGEAKITSGYKLPAKKVIHTVGPMDEIREKLQSCYKNCLGLVQEHKLKTVAFCCISTGIYAAIVAVETVKEWLEKNGDEVDRIIFCVFLDEDYIIYHRLMLKYFPCTIASGKDDDQDDCSKEKDSTKELSKTEKKEVETTDETTESAREDEGVQINLSDLEKVENDEAVHEMKKRKWDAGEKMDLDVDEGGNADKMDTEEVSGDEAQGGTVGSDKVA